MKLPEYIAAVDGSESEFARRTGIPQRTINRVCKGLVRCRIDIAETIVRASQARPAPCGGVVTFEELVPSEETAA